MEKKSLRSRDFIKQNVYEKALERIEYLYKAFDNIVVSFSGGKDSTALLNCTIEVAKKLKRLPVKTIFFDEEAIHPPTIEYVERTRQKKEIDLDWYCLPVMHRNACSNEQPYWYCWNPEEKDLWVRDMPENAITDHPKFKFGMSFQEFNPRMFPNSMGTVCVLTGLRTQESLRRLRIILSKKNDCFVNSKADFKNTYRAFPIYDWSAEDVWVAVKKFGWDYNRTYDIFDKTKLNEMYNSQRVCPPYGEEPLRGLWIYAECFPEMWHKMLNRVKGVATAWRYANTELYSYGLKEKPDGLTWKQYTDVCLDQYEEKERKEILKNINSAIKQHYNKTNDKIHDEEAHPITGASWKYFCKVVVKGDFKGRRLKTMIKESDRQLKKMGLSYEQAKKIYSKN